MSRILAALALLILPGCDVFPTMPAPYAPYEDEALSAIRYGTVYWEAVETDCPNGTWDVEVGMGLIEGDTITLWLETVPELTGTLNPGATPGSRGADLEGAMTFPGDTGATVSCVVEGTATVSDAEVAGEMTERLSSEGDLNCASRGRYTFVFDE